MDEYIDILNPDGSPTGKNCLKSEIHSKGHYHNTAHLWLFNDQGQILLAQRAASKAICPLLWDVSVAGHVDSGETIESAAVRETREEIGLNISTEDLEKIGVFECFQSYPNGIEDNEFHHTFISKIDRQLTQLTLDPQEVEKVKFVTIQEFYELLYNSTTNGHFVASNMHYYLKVIEAIKNKLT